MPEIIPAIIPENYDDLEEKLDEVRGLAPLVQIDITDGEFVPNRSWPFINEGAHREFEAIVSGKEGLPFWKYFEYEADLMIQLPEKDIEVWVNAGFSRVVVHVESTDDLQGLINQLDGRVEVGLALEIDTPNDAVDEFLSKVDFIQCMGIAQIGVQGEPFDERVIPKIEHFKEVNPGGIISVDGGVNFESAQKLKKVGVDRLVSGSAIFDARNVKEAVRTFESM